ncbi:superkiller complex protein 3 [Amyelois transitella]|uniref:superkiller complex protein 3 n=1 Tax=Amyelois transitella TaxID=680683 RepID=UPI00067CBD25|nr:superkiller complex protein 3 [Amyelois transitella]XP_013195924.1 superkiller complex protein 3 [Amyelois transitella]XP_060800327.1 superkiller complex protein 3 [Amyelois transitella]
MADIKALLKEARKLVSEENFKEAQECCKNILRKDKQNYMGLVLLGKALQDTDQAPLAYQKAIASKPDQLLAWQGLANYYEKKDGANMKIKLFSIYNEMLKLSTEEDRVYELILKTGQLGCTLKHNEAITLIINYLSRDVDDKLQQAAEKQLVEILKRDVECKQEDIPLTLKILNKIYNEDPSDSLEIIYAKVILTKNDFNSAVVEIIELKYFSKNVILREWLCKQICKRYIENNSFSNFCIEDYISRITEGIENSNYPGMLKSMIAYDKGMYLEAYKQCVPLVNYNQADPVEVTFIINCANKLRKWSIAQKLVTNFLTKAKDPDFFIDLKKFLFLSLSKQQKWNQAITIASEIPFDSLNKDEKAALAECYIEGNQPVDHILAYLKTEECYTSLKAQLLLKQNKYTEVIDLLDKHSDHYLNLFYIGKAYWYLGQHDQSLMNLLRAVKLNSEHAESFLFLGHYYKESNDLQRAKKCYEKAYSLVDTNSETIKNLSETYIKLNMKEKDLDLLVKSEKKIKGNESWIDFRLGLHYLSKRDWENAIIHFRNVIKSNKCDVTAFECLADAYYARGSFTSALRAYTKVMTLDSNKTAHCLTRIGYIHSLLTEYEDAIATFEKVLKLDPYSLMALKGISETWIRVAKKKFEVKMYGRARDCAQNAIDFIYLALKKNKQYTCLWKTLADTFILITRLPNKYAYVLLKNNDTSDNLVRKNKLELFPHALACYSRVAKQKQQLASYDLASTYLAYYYESKKEVNCNISFNLTLICIKEKPTLWRNWNLLGKICLFVKKYNIAQHCFIKALLVTRKWSVAKVWCNLGTLYLKLKLFKLANYCFWRGQSTLPSHPHSWIGQGLIAEVIREEEAMDLFRHASRLGYHPESALGYADWVCRTLKSNKYKESPETKYEIEGLYAITYAIDLIEWYSSFEPDNACANTILGILQERCGLIQAAYNSFQMAVKNADEENKNITLLNLGRIFLRMENYDEAIKTFKAITEASFDSTCGLALALYKNGLYEESYSVYDTALQWLSSDDEEQADMLVAMAGIMYIFKGADDAKTILFHSINVTKKKPTAYCLFAICSLGLLHSDQSLSKLALGELHKYEKDNAFGFDIGFLKSYLFVCENNINEAIKILSDSLHDFPSNALLWFCMSQYCLRASDTKAKIASSCAQRALCSSHNYDHCLESAKMIATASIAEHIAGDHIKALILAKEGLHMYPQQGEIWAALIFSLIPIKQWMDKKDWLLSAASHMRRNLVVSRPLIRWLNLIEKKLQSRVK